MSRIDDYSPVGWENGQIGNTPLSKTNLRHMDDAIDSVTDAVNEVDDTVNLNTAGIASLVTRVTKLEEQGTKSAISELTDVSLSDLDDGQILKYDKTEGVWKNEENSGGGSLELANMGIEQEVANVVESPFNFAIQDGIYGYMKKEADTDVFVPFKSDGAKIGIQHIEAKSGVYVKEAYFDFEPKFAIVFKCDSLPYRTVQYAEIGYKNADGTDHSMCRNDGYKIDAPIFDNATSGIRFMGKKVAYRNRNTTNGIVVFASSEVPQGIESILDESEV